MGRKSVRPRTALRKPFARARPELPAGYTARLAGCGEPGIAILEADPSRIGRRRGFASRLQHSQSAPEEILGSPIGTAYPTPITASLLGSDCQLVGGIAACAEGSAAIALSQGGARKRYPHTEPNEDAAGFALGESGVLLTVADGHSGREAAETAISELLGGAAPCLSHAAGSAIRERWAATALAMFAAAQNAILAGVARGARDSARTTLALAVVRPAERLLAYASIGDSHIFRVGADETVDLAFVSERHQWWLGNPAQDLEALASTLVVGTEEFGDTRAIVLATDGISEVGIGVDHPEFTVAQCSTRAALAQPLLRPLELARSVAEAALGAHRRHRSGDNIATAASWLSDPEAANG